MRTTVLLAVPEPWETTVVDAVAAAPGLELTRRCADLPELLSTAAAGLGESALVSAGLDGLDRTAVVDLERHGVRVVGVIRPGDEVQERQLRGRGIDVILPADAAPTRLQSVLTGQNDPEIRAWLAGLGAVDPTAPVTGGPAGSDGVGSDGGGRGSGGGSGDESSAEASADPTDGAASTAVASGDPSADPAAGSGDCGPGWQPREASELRVPRIRRSRGTAAATDATGRTGTGAVPARPGRVVAVWGPLGSPGRSSVALALASEVAHGGGTALLVDADPYGGVQAQLLAILDEAPGLAGAVRRADQGDLDVAGLIERCLQVAPGLSLLTGISRADRWPELRPDPLDRVLTLARQVADLVVVDCGFALEDDEELSYDTAAPRRNAATLATLACADHLVVVGAGEPVGLLRLVRGLAELDRVRTPARRTVIVNRLRESAVGRRPQQTVAAALERFAGLADVRFVPDDRDAFDRAALQGRTLAECAPTSPARLALAQLAGELAGWPGSRAEVGRSGSGRARRGRAQPTRADTGRVAASGGRRR